MLLKSLYKKRLLRYTLLSVLVFACPLKAQDHQPTLDNSRHFFSAYLAGGVHSLLFAPKDGTMLFGGGALGGLQYQHYFTAQWGLSAGVQLSSYNSGARYNFVEVSKEVVHPHNDWYYDALTSYSNWCEKQHLFAVGIPIEALYRMPLRSNANLVFGAGVLVDFVGSSTYETVEGEYQTQGYFYNTNTLYGELPKHGFTTVQSGVKGDNNTASVFLSVVADAGVNFMLNEKYRLYLGVYGGYGLTSIAKTDNVMLLTPYSLNNGEVVQATYNGTFASNQISSVHSLAFGLKVGVGISYSGKLLNLDFAKKTELEEVDKSHDSYVADKTSKDAAKDKAAKDAAKDKAAKDAAKDKAAKDAAKDKAAKDAAKDKAAKTNDNDVKAAPVNKQDVAVKKDAKSTKVDQKQASDKVKSSSAEQDNKKAATVNKVAQQTVPDPMFDYSESSTNGPNEAQTTMLMYIDMVKDYADGARFYADDKKNPDAYLAAAEAESASRAAVEAALLGDFDKVVAAIERSQQAFEKARNAKRIEQHKDTVVIVEEKKKTYLSELENPNIVLTVHFQVNGKDLSIDAASRVMLEHLADTLFENPNLKIRITGHTDNTGSASVNLRMGMHRAQNLAEYLEDMGVGSEQIEVLSKGQTEPIADNKTAQGRATNRRATIEILQ